MRKKDEKAHRYAVRNSSTTHQEREQKNETERKKSCRNYDILLGIRPLRTKGYLVKSTHQGLRIKEDISFKCYLVYHHAKINDL